MVTELIYQVDSYVREFNARVVKVRDNGVILDRTAFHPRTGGVSNDVGYLVKGDVRLKVTDVIIDKESYDVIHVLESAAEGLREGDVITGVIDWNRRYRLMRLHTAAHILAAIFYSSYNAVITGGNVYPDYAYDDYSLELFDRSIFEDVIAKANEVIKRGIEVRIYWLRRDEALKVPGIVKLASKMPPNVEFLRIVEIPGVDIQADGGPHVRNTAEVGEVTLLKVENKGRMRKRLYYTVRP